MQPIQPSFMPKAVERHEMDILDKYAINVPKMASCVAASSKRNVCMENFLVLLVNARINFHSSMIVYFSMLPLDVLL